MAAKPILAEEKPVIGEILEKKRTAQNTRAVNERQWLTNIAFLFGKQYFDISQARTGTGLTDRIVFELKDQQRKDKIKRVSNYILPLFRSMLARLLRMKASTTVEATTSDEKDKSAARVSREVIEDFWQTVNKNNPLLCQKTAGMVRVLARLFASLLACGKGYLMPYYNPKTLSKTYLAEKVMEGQVGEVEVEVLTAFDVFEDRLGMWKIKQRVMSVEAIKDQYGVEVDPESMGVSDIEQQLLNMLEGGSGQDKVENGAKVYEYFEVPSEKHPKGRYIITTANKLIHQGDIPPEFKSKIPLFEFTYLDFFFSLAPQGMIDQLISLQEEYNFTITKLYAYKKYFNGKVMVPKECKLESKYNEEVGQVIYYDPTKGKPHFETPPNPPTFLVGELDRIRRDMEDIASVHDSTKFDPTEIRSGTAIENLNELDNSQIGPVLIGIEQQLSFFAETVLDIIEVKYSEPRLITKTGESLSNDVKTFKGESVSGNRRIKISLGSFLPVSKGERKAFLMSLKKEGMITPDRALELMEFDDAEGVFTNLDENAQKIEIGEMLKNIVMVNDWDNHAIHLSTLDKYLKGQDFKKLDEKHQVNILAHRKGHQDALTKEMQIGAGQTPPLPGPAAPAIPQ